MVPSPTGGPTTVVCPTCEATVRIGLPHSAVVRTVNAGPASELGDAGTKETTERRLVEKACRNGHTFTVYYDW